MLQRVIIQITIIFFIGVASTVFPAFGQDQAIIRQIRFKGNTTLSTESLVEQISQKPSSFISRKYFNKEPSYYSQTAFEPEYEKLITYYQREGFLKVSIGKPMLKYSKDGKNVRIKIPIEEGPSVSIDSVNFAANGAPGLDQLLKRNELRYIQNSLIALKHTRFRDDNVHTDKAMIIDVFKQAGYPYTTVQPEIVVDTLTHKAHITWQVTTGPLSAFGPLVISGNEKVKSSIIEKQVTFKQGDTYNISKITNTQRQIYNLGMFRVASVRSVLTKSQNDTIPIRIILQEAPRYTSKYSVGYGKEEQFRASADFQFLGFLGGTRRLNLLVSHSKLEPYNFEVTFTQPAFLSPKGSAVINPFFTKEVEPAYQLVKHGINASYLHEISKHINGSITLFYEKIDENTSDVSEVTEDYAEGLYDKSGISMGFSYDNSEPVFDPIKGFSLAANTKTNGILNSSSYPFNRSLVEFKTYQAVNPRLTMAYKLKIGNVIQLNDTIPVPLEERFYAGGSYSVRGWGRSQLGPKDENGVPTGGNSLFEGSIEGRFRLNSLVIFPVFIDFGNVWQDSFTLYFNELRYSIGLGLRIKTPIGPAGIDMARPVFDQESKWQIHFNIGHPF